MSKTSVTLTGLSLLFLTGCSRSSSGPQSLAGPTSLNQDVVYDSSVQWDAAQLGRVWVTNPSPLFPLKLTLVIHKYLSEENQPIAALSPLHVLNAGEVRREITAGIALQCGTTYQRDLYTGGPWSTGDTLAELRNYFYAAPGALWKTPPCGQTPPAPPVVPPTSATCADEGLTLTRQPYLPSFGPTQTNSITAIFHIGPASVSWGDGTSEPLLSGVLTSHAYVRGAVSRLVTATVTTAQGCTASVLFEISGLGGAQ